MLTNTGGLPITQIAMVVKDLRKTMEIYHTALGWGPWNVYEHKPPLLHSTELRGKPTPFTMLGAEVKAGPIIFAITQALQDAMAQRLLAVSHRSPSSPSVKEMVNTHGAHMEAIERYLGVPAGTVNRVDAGAVKSWMAALRRANAAAQGRR